MSRILPIIALMFAVGLFFLYIRPTYTGSIHDTKQQIESYDSALAAADRFEQKEAQLSQQESQIPADSLSKLNEFLPDGVDNVQLILDLDALAARSSMTLSDFDIGNQTGSTAASASSSTPSPTGTSLDLGLQESTPIDSLDLTFKGTGTYSSFRTFLAGVENSLRPLDVVDISVNESTTGVYTYSMAVRLYWLH